MRSHETVAEMMQDRDILRAENKLLREVLRDLLDAVGGANQANLAKVEHSARATLEGT